MKYNEKTGEKKPENRTDEIRLSMEKLIELRKKFNGTPNYEFEANFLLQDISISMGLLVDIAASIYNKMIEANKVR